MKIPNGWVTFGKLRGHLVFIFSFLTYKVLLAVCRTSLSRQYPNPLPLIQAFQSLSLVLLLCQGLPQSGCGGWGRPVTLRFVASYVTSDKSLNFSKPGFAHH